MSCYSCLVLYLHDIIWAIHQELFFMSILKKFVKLQKKKTRWSYFGKVVGLQHPNLLKWNATIRVFLVITDIMFWGIFRNSNYMEPLQITDKFCSSSSVIFQHVSHIVISVVIRNGKTFHLLSILYHHDLVKLCVFT